MKYKQVFPAGRGEFTFRLTLPAVGRFQADETYPDEEYAAFAADLLKLYLSKKFGLRNFALRPSLPLAAFVTLCRENGIDPAKLDDIHFSLSFSTKEMLLNGGHEMITEYAANEKESQKGWGSLAEPSKCQTVAPSNPQTDHV